MISGETKAALGESTPAGIRLRSLGRHRLPGLAEAAALFQVVPHQAFPPTTVEHWQPNLVGRAPPT